MRAEEASTEIEKNSTNDSVSLQLRKTILALVSQAQANRASHSNSQASEANARGITQNYERNEGATCGFITKSSPVVS
jgi:hypothetical protein